MSLFVLQFAVLMWLLTYVGALFNGLTLLILGEVISTRCVSHSPPNTAVDSHTLQHFSLFKDLLNTTHAKEVCSVIRGINEEKSESVLLRHI